MALPQFKDHNAEANIEQLGAIYDLHYMQMKSSAVETLFTLSLLTFSWMQVGSQFNTFSETLLKIGILRIDPATAIYLATVAYALLIGGENLVKVTRTELGLDEEKDQEAESE